MSGHFSRSIEARLVVSPTKGFHGQVALFAASALALGYTTDDLVIKVFTGASAQADIDPIWNRPIPLCEVLWSDRERVARESFHAQCDDAFTHDEFDAAVVVYCDADTVWLRRFDDLVSTLASSHNSIAGVTAHYPPPGFSRERHGYWDELAHSILGESLTLDYACSIRRDIPLPFYLNFGFVAAKSSVFRNRGEDFIALTRKVEKFISRDRYFKYQLALPFFCKQFELNCISLPPIYNFINDLAYENLYLGQMGHIKVLHYLRSGNFDRASIFLTPKTYQDFVQKNLTGVDQIFQTHVRKLWGPCPPHLASRE